MVDKWLPTPGHVYSETNSFENMVAATEQRLLSAVVHTAQSISCDPSTFPPFGDRRPGLRMRSHPFTLSSKGDNKNFIPRVLLRELAHS